MKQPQIFFIHFAGGNRYSYRFLESRLFDFEMIPLELPGRGARMREPLLKDFDVAAQDLCQQITARLNTPQFLICGHSMGAYLTLRVTKLLEQAGRYPTGIIVSGNAGPGIEDPEKKIRYQLPREAFIEELKRLGGLPQEVIDHEELFGIFEPILRADFEIVERNELAKESPVQAPLYAMMGDQEDDVADIDNWSRFTRSRFRKQVLTGDHFFIFKHPDRMAEIIRTFYRQEQEQALPQQ
ncbi:MAG TPA: alpha/beta fold hydrolase [Chitinophaga sp.]